MGEGPCDPGLSSIGTFVVECGGPLDPARGGEVGEQALEAVHRQAVVGIYLGHKEVRYGGNSYPGHSPYPGGGVSASRHPRPHLRPARPCPPKSHPPPLPPPPFPPR